LVKQVTLQVGESSGYLPMFLHKLFPVAAERHRFHPAGWTAVPDRTACVGCRQCVDTPHGCPMASSLAAGLLFLLRRHWLSFAPCLRYNQRYQTK
ncbi:MAG: hypothetical protein IKC76_04465, partial [Firmicutes bacterium]|nr:hypothetical protein [Bacillota bacterium]